MKNELKNSIDALIKESAKDTETKETKEEQDFNEPKPDTREEKDF